MALKNIIIKGAREHNLKNIDIELPRDKMIVITGLSGSGKSSLAFDTIYAEGQRRYVESLSSYARQFLGQMEKPKVDLIEGLSPAISIDQKTTTRNPRSTVGTVTEIYDYLRLLYARVGIPHCPVCGRQIKQQTVDQIVDKIMDLPDGTKMMIMAPIVRAKKGMHKKTLESARRSGFVRARVDSIIYDLSEDLNLNKNKKHNIEIVVDRLVKSDTIGSRLTDSVETAIRLASGLVIVNVVGGEDLLFSQSYACPEHGISVEELTPAMFSFNNPLGVCPKCTGLGVVLKIDPDLVIPNKYLSIERGAIRAAGWAMNGNTVASMYYRGLAKHYNFSLRVPVNTLPDEIIDILLYGTKGEKIKVIRTTEKGESTYITAFEGIANNLERRFRTTQSTWIKDEIRAFMSSVECDSCHGDKLNELSLKVTVGGINISDFCKKNISQAIEFIDNLKLTGQDAIIAEPIVKEIKSRLQFLKDVGLSYLTLARPSGTLSGGESQRIRLATQIGSSLTGVLYILDEPSIGLHQRDNTMLLKTLRHLQSIGNTVIVVEHDEDTIREADHIVDVGPRAGVHGGEIVFSGSPKDIERCENSLTGQYLSGKLKIPIPTKRRTGNGRFVTIKGATHHNLKNINVQFPLGCFICVTGVSGSGKSSLVNDILYKALANELNRAKKSTGEFKKIFGYEHLTSVININQAPIGRTPRSNPATYTGLFTDIRDLFASTNDAKARGFASGRFSFNIKGGRCEACKGDGILKIEMHFLPDIFVTCEVCNGQRYNRETLAVKYKGKSIHDVLEMTVDEGLTFFEHIPKIARRLQTLHDVGLGYIKIGQSSTTLSGGEAQRIKLAAELSKINTGKNFYILDEPTTGLHIDDVHKLINILQKLVATGNTVVVIEHNLDLIKTCDYIIDLGPEGGDNGGCIVAQGTPEEITEVANSYTGAYLKKVLNNS